MDAVAIIQTLIDYNGWATRRILAAAGPLSDEELRRTMPGAGHGSLWGQLAHIVQVEIGWVIGWTGQADSQEAAWAQMGKSDRFDFETRAGLWRAFELSQHDLEVFGRELTAEALARPFRPEQLGGLTLADVMLQVLTHGQHHRGETAALLSAIGHSPGDVDYLFPALERVGVKLS